ncbi:hypothetical protein B0T17DRAFT_295184 [Bombardia bombarda]|uniref:Uncharacterized protein n=1 Tax=Bombardia bombarda TaxID=252184 RepID=A0AA40C166_9PEZI|nr:hypothetical protein B0T17DRAFT_295184 [Bombardia bombarda]
MAFSSCTTTQPVPCLPSTTSTRRCSPMIGSLPQSPSKPRYPLAPSPLMALDGRAPRKSQHEPVSQPRREPGCVLHLQSPHPAVPLPLATTAVHSITALPTGLSSALPRRLLQALHLDQFSETPKPSRGFA